MACGEAGIGSSCQRSSKFYSRALREREQIYEQQENSTLDSGNHPCTGRCADSLRTLSWGSVPAWGSAGAAMNTPLDRLRELSEKATQGTWEVFKCSFSNEDPDSACGLNGQNFDCSYDECHHPVPLTDAQFIVACVNYIRAALAEVRGEICGFCGQPGADKIPHPVRWPNEHHPGSELVHAACEAEECRRAHQMLSDKERERFLRNL